MGLTPLQEEAVSPACEDDVRRQPSASQEESPHEERDPLAR